MGNKEKILFIILYLQGEAYKFMIPNYDLYLQDKRLVLWFGVHKVFIKKLEEMYGNMNIVATAE